MKVIRASHMYFCNHLKVRHKLKGDFCFMSDSMPIKNLVERLKDFKSGEVEVYKEINGKLFIDIFYISSIGELLEVLYFK